MSEALLSAMLSGVSVLLILFGVVRLLRSDRVIGARLGQYAVADAPTAAKSARPSPLAKGVDRLVANKSFSANIARDLARANLKLTVSEYVMIHGATIMGGFAVAFLLARNPIFALIGALVGFYAPGLYVRRRHKKRLGVFNSQLGDTITLMVNSLRSGYSLLQSLDLIAREGPQPSAEEFSRVVREVSLGLSPEEALANLVRRIDSDDLDLLVTAINVQHEVGGNLAQILETIGQTIRERVRIKGEIKVLTSQQTLSGYVITFLPIGLGLLLFIMNPKYLMQLFSTEQMICMPVIAMPICGAVMMVAGFLTIKRIVAIDV